MMLILQLQRQQQIRAHKLTSKKTKTQFKPMSKTSTSSGETNQDDVTLHFLGSVLIHPSSTNEESTSTDLGRWTAIFSFLHFNEYERLSVRTLCRLFRTVLPGPTCAGVYTIYPHPNHTSLRSLIDRLNALSKEKTDNVPSLLLIADGVHTIEIYKNEDGDDCNSVVIDFPITIIGASKDGCTIIGSLHMKGKKEDDMNVKNLTISQSKGFGVRGDCGMSIHLFNLNIEFSEGCGVCVNDTKRNTMSSCQVSHSIESGVTVWDGGLMTMKGSGTSIHNNVTSGNSTEYGLDAWESSCSIHLASSLTIETISKNNEGGGNCGGKGTIAIVDNEGTIIETIQEATVDDD